MPRLILILIALLFALPAFAQEGPARGPAPSWARVEAPMAPTSGAAGAFGFRVLLMDQQARFDETGSHVYVHSVVQVQSIQGLGAVGTIVAPWHPGSQTLTVHAVDIRRGGEVIDALAGREFEILRREENLSSSTLDGMLTATLQPAGLRVGDILDFSYTLSTRNPVLGDHTEFLFGGSFSFAVDRIRIRASWAADRDVRVRAVAPWSMPDVARTGDQRSVEFDFRDVQPLSVPNDAPARFRHVRQLEFTDYRSWSEISALMAPLYAWAAVLAPDSPLHAEVERIRTTWSTPEEQAVAALRLVQDDVRYVAWAMGEAGLVPAGADETWARRFGDCKGKSALLVALLTELGIEARPALISVRFGDGLDERLPLVGLLDHVIVQAVIGGETYWLDGTRNGDRSLTAPLPFVWAIPVTEAGEEPVPLPVAPLTEPTNEAIVQWDVSDGLRAPARIDAALTMRGDLASLAGLGFTAIPEDEVDAGLREIWESTVPGLEIETVTGGYDAETNVFQTRMTGRAPMNWSRPQAGAAARYVVDGSAPTINIYSSRPDGPYADLPIAVQHPSYSFERTTIILPNGGEGYSVDGEPLDRQLAGHRLIRNISVEAGVVTIEASVLSTRSEVDRAELDAARDEIRVLRNGAVAVVAPLDYALTDGDRAALQADAPTDAAGYVRLGQLLAGNGETEAAIEAFDAAIAMDADNAEAWAMRGLARLGSTDPRTAGPDLERALDLDPAHEAALTGRAALSMTEGRFDDAVLDYSRLIRVAGRSAELLAARAYAYAAAGDFTRALADIDAAVALEPEQSGFKLLRAVTLADAGRVDEGVAAVDALIEAGETGEGVWVTRADILIDADRLDEAMAGIERGLELHPDDPDLLQSRAEVLILTGDEEGARAVLAQVREGAADDIYRLNSLCWLQGTRRFALDDALADCEAALVLSPGEPSITDSRAMVHLQAGRFEEALADYEAALAAAPLQAASLYGRGLARIALGREAEGRADLAAALALSPDVVEDFAAYEAAQDVEP